MRPVAKPPLHEIRVRLPGGRKLKVGVQLIVAHRLAVEVAYGVACFLGGRDMNYVAAPTFVWQLRDALAADRVPFAECRVQVVRHAPGRRGKRSRVILEFPVTLPGKEVARVA